jgi:hypothetical protein
MSNFFLQNMLSMKQELIVKYTAGAAAKGL